MHAGVLDMLHHPADHTARAIRNRVDVRFERVFEEAVDQYRMFRRDARRLDEVVAQRAVVVDDLMARPPST